MSHFDVFNGDADGLCALHQLRLAEPRCAELVTGVKRDIALLARVPAVAGDSLTVLDISLATNREALLSLLERGARIQYFDHHQAAEIPAHPGLQATIDPGPDACTSALVDRFLDGSHRPWAVVGAFGDALPTTAGALAATLHLDGSTQEQFRRLGECINYNSYGDSAADQMYRPEALYYLMQPYRDPLRFMAEEEAYRRLAQQYGEDLGLALALKPLGQEESAALFQLPDAAWARRIVGPFANRLKATAPGQAHAVLVPNCRGNFTVSLRVPAVAPVSADRFARAYGGNGRVIAAGINDLSPDAAAGFAQEFLHTYRNRPNPPLSG